MTKPFQTAGGRIGHQFSLSQKVPWPEKLDARGQVACREVQVARAVVARRETEIIEAVRLAYYELWLAAELVRIVDDNTELVEDLITVSEARYKTGGSQQDVLRAELEGDRLAEQLIALRRQREQARADLGALVRMPMNYMPVAADELNVDELAPQIEQLVAQAEQCNPTLQGLAAEIARDRAKESLACLPAVPRLSTWSRILHRQRRSRCPQPRCQRPRQHQLLNWSDASDLARQDQRGHQ